MDDTDPAVVVSKPKKWGKVDKAALYNLIKDGSVDRQRTLTRSTPNTFPIVIKRTSVATFVTLLPHMPSRVSTVVQGGVKVSFLLIFN